MSHPDKIKFLASARDEGYRTYLYFVSTENPDINVARVQQRVTEKGHSVPQQKIIERYTRSLDNLYDAIMSADRAFIFDNSDKESRYIAEFSDDRFGNTTYKYHTDTVPAWFEKFVIDKLPK